MMSLIRCDMKFQKANMLVVSLPYCCLYSFTSRSKTFSGSSMRDTVAVGALHWLGITSLSP
ncbi:hypothetical protein O9992_07720 [Vibrio lentus]|nr:hypothetical protein [Vibrio lentus]